VYVLRTYCYIYRHTYVLLRDRLSTFNINRLFGCVFLVWRHHLRIINAHFQTFFSTIFLFLTFLNIHIYFIILKTYDQQFTFTTKKSLHIIFKTHYLTCAVPLCYHAIFPLATTRASDSALTMRALYCIVLRDFRDLMQNQATFGWMNFTENERTSLAHAVKPVIVTEDCYWSPYCV